MPWYTSEASRTYPRLHLVVTDEGKQWAMSFPQSDSQQLHAPLCEADRQVLSPALSTMARLVDGELGITPEEAFEAALVVASYARFIRVGLLHIGQERREVHRGT